MEQINTPDSSCLPKKVIAMTEAATPPRPDLSPEDLDSKCFRVAKYIMQAYDSGKRCYVQHSIDELRTRLAQAGLRNELVLLQYIEKGINEHNGSIKAQETKLSDVREYGWKRSKYFKKINFDRLSNVVKKYQHTPDPWDIYKIILSEKISIINHS